MLCNNSLLVVVLLGISPQDCCLQGTGHVSAVPGLDGVNAPPGLMWERK